MFHSKEDFVDGIEDLEMGVDPVSSRWAQCDAKSPRKREAESKAD